jgi:glycine/D-amino acid oxidase-like deaminating enzyme
MPFRIPTGARSIENSAHDLLRFTPTGFAPKGYDVRRGEAAERLRWLENRVRHLHPALASVRVTHRWGGPILFTEKMLPIFRWFTPQGFTTKGHPRSKQVMVLAGYNGHGVALSVYLGKWAAEALLARRPLPPWH